MVLENSRGSVFEYECLIPGQSWDSFYESTWRVLLLWDGLSVRGGKTTQEISVRGKFCWTLYTAAWARPAPWARGRPDPSRWAALSPSSWNRSRRLARPADHPGCPPAAHLGTPPATRRCCSASSWWTAASLCSGASPWHTRPGTVDN